MRKTNEKMISGRLKTAATEKKTSQSNPKLKVVDRKKNNRLSGQEKIKKELTDKKMKAAQDKKSRVRMKAVESNLVMESERISKIDGPPQVNVKKQKKETEPTVDQKENKGPEGSQRLKKSDVSKARTGRDKSGVQKRGLKTKNKNSTGRKRERRRDQENSNRKRQENADLPPEYSGKKKNDMVWLYAGLGVLGVVILVMLATVISGGGDDSKKKKSTMAELKLSDPKLAKLSLKRTYRNKNLSIAEKKSIWREVKNNVKKSHDLANERFQSAVTQQDSDMILKRKQRRERHVFEQNELNQSNQMVANKYKISIKQLNDVYLEGETSNWK